MGRPISEDLLDMFRFGNKNKVNFLSSVLLYPIADLNEPLLGNKNERQKQTVGKIQP